MALNFVNVTSFKRSRLDVSVFQNCTSLECYEKLLLFFCMHYQDLCLLSLRLNGWSSQRGLSFDVQRTQCCNQFALGLHVVQMYCFVCRLSN